MRFALNDENEDEHMSYFEHREFVLMRLMNKKVDIIYKFLHPYYKAFKEPNLSGIVQRIHFSDDLSLMLERLGDQSCNFYEILP